MAHGTPETNYQYFWLKIVTARDIESRGREALDNPQAEMYSSVVPDHQYVVPRSRQTKLRLGDTRIDAQFSVNLEVNPREAMEKGLTVTYSPMMQAMTRQQALDWIGHGPGKEWARDGLCVLCTVAIEPVAPGAA